jgi:large repetitive protein
MLISWISAIAPRARPRAPDGRPPARGTFRPRVELLESRLTPDAMSMALAGVPATSVYGQQVTFTATVWSGQEPVTEGSVAFEDITTGNALGTLFLDQSGTAALMTNALSLGNHRIRATYSSTTGGHSGISLTVNHIVNTAPTTTTLSSSDGSSVLGQPVTFTATVSAGPASSAVPTGIVHFFVDGSHAGAFPVGPSGAASFSTSTLYLFSPSPLPLGNFTVEARYESDSNNFGWDPFSGPTVTHEVTVAPTVTTVTASRNPSLVNGLVTFTATVSAAPSTLVPTGTVTFFVDGAPAGPFRLDPSGRAFLFTAALAPGNHAVTAAFTSDRFYIVSGISGVFLQTIARPVAVTLVKKGSGPNRRLFVRLVFADTNQVKSLFRSPFQKPAYRAIAVSLVDADGDGLPEAVLLSARKGKKLLSRRFPA